MSKSSGLPKQSSIKKRIIRCECGAEILLLPDFKAMDRAISKHAMLHAEKEKDSKKAEDVLEYFENYLIEQVFDILAEEEY